ncbi:hypothetical protein LUCX_40 [Xanthomonas phage vB_XciM_LucasX]|nr:hypothetical protein LUCX_40 [Xanthomonas phage vB_XciM_LucasX]
MQESIRIQYNPFANPAAVDAFMDTLSEQLAAEGSAPTITSEKVGPFALDGQQFRVVWTGSYAFSSPDQYYNFGQSDLRVEVETTDLDFSTFEKFTAGRERAIKMAYREALRGVYNMSASLAEGHHTPTLPKDAYIRNTLEEALAAFPNSN